MVAAVALAASGAPSRASASDTQPSFWPADPAEVAIVANDQRMAITDGDTTIDLGKLPGGGLYRWEESWSGGTASAGDLVAFLPYSERRDELVVVNLHTGDVVRAACDDCWGVGVVAGHVVTVTHESPTQPTEPPLGETCPRPDCAAVTTEFSGLRIYDANLALQSVVPITLVTEPPSPTGIRDNPFPVVVGTADGQIVVSYTTTNGISRGGPSVVALYALDGTLGRHWTVDGAVYGVAGSADGRFLALGVGGSGGACNSSAAPVAIDTQAPNPSALARDTSAARWNYVTTDLWWNGYKLVTTGIVQNPRQGPCVLHRDVHQFALTGEISTADTPHLEQYRLLGTGCDRALVAITHGRERLNGYKTRLYIAAGGERRRLRPYESILWTPPRAQTCHALPEFSGRGRFAFVAL
jgi:hypothetical protein